MVKKQDFLDRLFWAVSSEKGIPSVDRRLAQLYNRTQIVRTAWDPVNSHLERLDLDSDQADALSNAICVLAEAHELQGFKNGFRLGMMLYGEVEGGLTCETNHLSAESPSL